MKYKKYLSFCILLLLLLLSAGACFGVTVPGSDGTRLTLEQIPDIIRHVTGKTSGDLAFEKESLLVTLLNGSPGEGYHIKSTVCGFASDGTPTNAGQGEDQTERAAYCGVLDDDLTAYYSQRIPMATYPQKASDGINVTPAIRFDNGGCDISVSSPSTDSDGNKTASPGFDWGAYSLRDAINASAAPSAIENAMTVKGSDHYISAVLVRNFLGDDLRNFGDDLRNFLDDNSPSVNLYFVKISGDSAYGAEKIPCDFSTNVDNCPKMSDGTYHFPASIAAGDFDNDGYRNELALTWSDVDHVYLKVVQLSYDTGTNQYSLKEIYSSTIHDYEYGSVGIDRNRCFDMDGAGTIFSTSVAAGNFDGNPGDEFAVVFRDNHPEHADKIYKTPTAHYYANMARHYTGDFQGLTGGINIVTHKWDGSTFQTNSARKTYDTYGTDNGRWSKDYYGRYTLTLYIYYYFPLAARAIAADLNGDGRDEIVVQRMTFNFCDDNTIFGAGGEDHSFHHFIVQTEIDIWNFDRGSIAPNQASTFTAAGLTYQGGKGTQPVYASETLVEGISVYHYPRSMFLKMVSRTDKPYPFFEREFDILKGKFTGRIGDVITVDDLIIKHPIMDRSETTKLDGTNYVKSTISLLKDYDGKKSQTKELTEISKPDGTNYITRDYAVGFMTANFLGEGVKLGDPVKITINKDDNYTAILQAMPYHVDNITPDGTALTKEPQNFTLRKDTSVVYTNASKESEAKSMTYSMTKKAETIFALDSDVTRGAASAFQGVRGIVSTLFGSTEKGKSVEAAGAIWDKLKDTVETTTSKSNENATEFEMTITQQANYHDSLYYSRSSNYLWRYPVLTYPAPDWLMGNVKDTLGNFDNSKAKEQQTYITFAMSEPNTPATGIDINDTDYQPYHELGNLFSYPADLSQVEGYEGHTYMANNTYQESSPIEWRGSHFKQDITFTKSETNQEETKKVNKAGPVSRFLSMFDNLFGTSLAHIPYDSDSSFKRTVTEKEGLSIKIPEAYSGARFYVRLAPYLDVAGTTTVAFAVTQFVTDDALWGTHSLYTLKPDPSFLLPQKFNHNARVNSDNDSAVFTANTNDPTAIKGLGIRFIAADYDMYTDNLLMKGIKYKIRIPVYNASFKTANNVLVRLSHAKTNDYNAKRTHIADYTFATLPGRDQGNHRGYAEFEWTPDIADGVYYLFADIDPEHKIDEVHENRHASDSNKTIVDIGGNNMAYFRIGIASSNTLKFDRNQLEVARASDSDSDPDSESEANLSAALPDSSVFPYIEWVKADSLDIEDFIEQKVNGASEPVPAEVEVKYVGEYLMNDVNLVGYKLKPEATSKDVSAVTDEDIALIFVNKDFHLFPGEDHKLHFRINPEYLEDGIGFSLHVHGEEFPLTGIIHGSAGTGTDDGLGSEFLHGSSSGGCNAGYSVLALIALSLMIRRKTH
ncbi:MAG: SYNERG-CTERM sorting domain-containing protein [Synergistaceae bacterium]|nr:SYNERG-CTERM sorting domain-containing protein [Synergistaceae bacterium]